MPSKTILFYLLEIQCTIYFCMPLPNPLRSFVKSFPFTSIKWNLRCAQTSHRDSPVCQKPEPTCCDGTVLTIASVYHLQYNCMRQWGSVCFGECLCACRCVIMSVNMDSDKTLINFHLVYKLVQDLQGQPNDLMFEIDKKPHNLEIMILTSVVFSSYWKSLVKI